MDDNIITIDDDEENEFDVSFTPDENLMDDRYSVLRGVFDEAYKQAAEGKGDERHGSNESFDEQGTCRSQRQGYDFARGQADKKICESLRLPAKAAVRELYGAINYLAAAIIVLKEGIDE